MPIGPAGAAACPVIVLPPDTMSATLVVLTVPSRRVCPGVACLAACAVGLLLAPGAIGQPRPFGSPPSGAAPVEPAPLRVTTALVEGRTVQRSVDTVGSLLAWEEAIARSQLSGTIVRLHVDLGDAVREGQPLADLDRREADLTIDQLGADLAAARENLGRAR